jgi:hypothetical protein
MLELGRQVHDKLTGFSGIAIGRVEYSYDPPSILVQPPVNKDGEYVEAKWIEEERLEYPESSEKT